MVSVGVRGMYATALSKLLVDTGFKLVEASEKIRERLGLEFEVHPCDVTVKDADSLDELLVVGFPHEAKSVYSTLLEKLAYVFNWSSQIELHAVYLGKVIDRKGCICAVDIGDAKGTLSPCKEGAGDVTIVGVKRPAVKPNETLYLTRNFRLVGRYVVLIHGDPKLTFSEHIVDHEVRARLSSAATSKLLGTGLGVHFRSSSKYATTEAIFSEIDRLLAEYSEIVSRINKAAAPMKLREGEFIGILGLNSLAKKSSMILGEG
ncbi:MAG: ribonuclease E/G [Desulfurococcaceae archaeon]